MQLLKSSNTKIVTKLVSVTVIGQIIALGLSPVIARLFLPEMMGAYADIIAYSAIIATLMNGRYDLALIEVKKLDTSKHLIKLSLIIGLFLSLIFATIGFFIDIINQQNFKDEYYFVIIIGFLVSQVSVVNHFRNSVRHYDLLSINKLIQSIIPNLLLILVGLTWKDINSMLLAYLVGLLIILIVNKKIYSPIFSMNPASIKLYAKKYYRYPKFLIPSTLCSELSGNLPIIMTSSFFGLSTAGYIYMANRLISIPITFLGNSIGEVYRERAVEQYNNKGNCEKLFFQFLIFLVITGSIFSLGIFFLSEFLVELVYGNEWVDTGIIMKYYSVMMFFQYISTPLSYSIVLKNNQKFDLILQIIRLLLVVFSFLIGYLNNDFYLAIKLYVFGYSIYYFLHSILQFKSVK